MELNVFNGDCAHDAWLKSGGTEPSLVWRENYLEGRIPGLESSLAEFEQIRAEELHRLMPELNFDKLLSHLRHMDATITGLTARDSDILWFDACMYDQIMLSRILFLLNATSASVFLICEDVAWGDSPERFNACKNRASRLSRDDIALYASAWEAVSRDCKAIDKLLADTEIIRFPFLAKALTRYREDFPGADGLGRSERQLLEIIRSGKHDGMEIFRECGKHEEYPFMGDTMCLRLLEKLVKKGFLVIETKGNNKTYSIR